MQENLLGLVEQAGVVGAGGAGFPTHVKLKAQADTVIINGAECEPLLRVDQQLMALRAGDLLDALDLLVEQVGASQGVVALKEHYHAAVEALERELSRHPRLRIHRMGAFYPAGDEQVIVYEVTGRVVPEGGIPLNVGVVVSNVETALNVLAAVRHQAPVIEKYVTLTGAVRTPKTVKVPLGITVAEALALAVLPVLRGLPAGPAGAPHPAAQDDAPGRLWRPLRPGVYPHERLPVLRLPPVRVRLRDGASALETERDAQGRDGKEGCPQCAAQPAGGGRAVPAVQAIPGSQADSPVGAGRL